MEIFGLQFSWMKNWKVSCAKNIELITASNARSKDGKSSCGRSQPTTGLLQPSPSAIIAPKQMYNNPEINKALERTVLCFVLVFLDYNPTKILF